jgi:putative MFS transporter
MGAPGVEEVVDRIGFGRFQRRLLLACGVTWAADAAELLAIGFALPGIREDFGLDATQAGYVAAAAFVGMLLGATFWGTIADRIGRRRGFQLTVLVFAVFGTASAFAPTPRRWCWRACSPASGSAVRSRSTSA